MSRSSHRHDAPQADIHLPLAAHPHPVLHDPALASAAGGCHVGDGSQPGRPVAAHGGVGEGELLLVTVPSTMEPLAFIAFFGGLAYWPIFMVFHRRWSAKAKVLAGIFLGTLGSLAAVGGFFILMVRRGYDIHTLWPLQFVPPIITCLSLAISLGATVVLDDDGNVT